MKKFFHKKDYKLFTIDEFKQTTQPAAKTKLSDFKSEIIELKKAGYTYKQIQIFLKKNDVEIVISAIQKFYKRHQNEPLKKAVNSSRSEPIKPSLERTTQNVSTMKNEWKKPEWASKDLDIDSMMQPKKD